MCIFKNYLIAGLYSCDTRYPASAWRKLIPQAVIIINLLCPSQRSLSLSAYTAVWGNFNFNANSLAPPGIKVLVHLKTDQIISFEEHGIDIWYVGPGLNHYRCYIFWIPEINGTRDTDTANPSPNRYHSLK